MLGFQQLRKRTFLSTLNPLKLFYNFNLEAKPLCAV